MSASFDGETVTTLAFSADVLATGNSALSVVSDPVRMKIDALSAAGTTFAPNNAAAAAIAAMAAVLCRVEIKPVRGNLESAIRRPPYDG